MSVSQKIKTAMERGSWIRRMFEEGGELKARLGADKVSDFTLGNPDLEPPARFKEALLEAVRDPSPGLHGYMTNAGLLHTRQALAGYLRTLYHQDFDAGDLILTCGAAGALNVICKAILDPGDEVIVLSPYFPEYLFYADNHGGMAVVVETDLNFQLDLKAIEGSLSPRTKAVIINSPNNPTGQIYPAPALAALGQLLEQHSDKHGRVVYLVADEPYSRILYDGVELPNIFGFYPQTLLATSFSKDLSIPGERLGLVAVSPQATYRQELLAGFVLANRILGFINAPALMQRVVAKVPGLCVDTTPYARRRDLLGQILSEAGYRFLRPQGAFYFFPEAPGGDDLAFVHRLKQENILAVPGRGFGRVGYFRLAFCVPETVIERAAAGFIKAAKG
jgi:aspartate aminotransferase|uniref:Aminotransferase n=1 Tax=Desulfobacca acetoxidans TaxID=60893 RepID=A0A7V6DPK9_9BACT